MGAVRNSTAEVIKARPRHRARPRRAPVFRPIKPPPPQKPSRRGRWLLIRLLLTVALSLVIHGLVWLFSPNPRPSERSLQQGAVEFEVKQVGPKKISQAPTKTNETPVTRAPPKPIKPTTPAPPKPDRDRQPPADVPNQAFVPTPSPTPVAPQAPSTAGGSPSPSPPSHPGGATRPDGKPVQLFDPNALGQSVDRFNQSLPSKDQFMDPSSKGDGNDPAATEARITGRLNGVIAQANAEGRVAGGLVSSCNDGFDNDFDGKIDCADMGCRLLPVCKNTKEFKYQGTKEIPDDDTRGLVTKVVVKDDDEETIRAISVSIDLVHGSPGDLSIDVEHNGETQRVLLANPATHYFPKAFYLGDFIGKDPQGTWTVTIRDVIRGTTGRLRGWVLYVTR